METAAGAAAGAAALSPSACSAASDSSAQPFLACAVSHCSVMSMLVWLLQEME